MTASKDSSIMFYRSTRCFHADGVSIFAGFHVWRLRQHVDLRMGITSHGMVLCAKNPEKKARTGQDEVVRSWATKAKAVSRSNRWEIDVKLMQIELLWITCDLCIINRYHVKAETCHWRLWLWLWRTMTLPFHGRWDVRVWLELARPWNWSMCQTAARSENEYYPRHKKVTGHVCILPDLPVSLRVYLPLGHLSHLKLHGSQRQSQYNTKWLCEPPTLFRVREVALFV